jgi:hypothetical protein
MQTTMTGVVMQVSLFLSGDLGLNCTRPDGPSAFYVVEDRHDLIIRQGFGESRHSA